MQIKFIFKWFDFWMGVFIDKPNKRIYIFYFPMCGILIQLKTNYHECTDKELIEIKNILETHNRLLNKESIDTIGNFTNCGVEFHIHK